MDRGESDEELEPFRSSEAFALPAEREDEIPTATSRRPPVRALKLEVKKVFNGRKELRKYSKKVRIMWEAPGKSRHNIFKKMIQLEENDAGEILLESDFSEKQI